MNEQIEMIEACRKKVNAAMLMKLHNLLINAKCVDEAIYAYEALADMFNGLQCECEAEQMPELPEVSKEEIEAEIFYTKHLAKEAAYSDFESRGVSRGRVDAYLSGMPLEMLNAYFPINGE